MGYSMGLDKDKLKDFSLILRGLYKAFLENDASLAEINPLAVDGEGRLQVVDAKILIDDNALYRQKALEAMRDLDEEDPYEREAREKGLSYVRLNGNIGCMVNGAGLAMATMDSIKLYGGEPANFLDVGGGAGAEKVASALRIILSDRNVRAVLFNIFGGITRCDVVAQGIMAALGETRPSVPMVVRLVGTNEEEGRRILSQAKLITTSTMQEAAQKVVELSRG
jgi:succinyl-CoA synthetase beta subunit